MNSTRDRQDGVPVPMAARHWVLRLDEMSDAERGELERWLAACDLHRQAFEEAKREWRTFARLEQLRWTAVGEGDPWVARRYVRRRQFRRRMPVLVSAAMLGLAAVLAYWSIPRPEVLLHVTDIGEQRQFSLPDRSLVMLNTDSRLSGTYTQDARSLRLERGEAHFEVAHDASRPFIVMAGPGTIRALGTAFHVRVTDSGLKLTVTEGTIEVTEGTAPWNTSENAAEYMSLTLTRGQKLHFTETGREVAFADPDSIDRGLAWRHGMLEFVDAPLAEVIAEAARYTTRALEISDPALVAHRVTVIARARNIDGLLRDLAASTDAIDVTWHDDRIEISRPRAGRRATDRRD